MEDRASIRALGGTLNSINFCIKSFNMPSHALPFTVKTKSVWRGKLSQRDKLGSSASTPNHPIRSQTERVRIQSAKSYSKSVHFFFPSHVCSLRKDQGGNTDKVGIPELFKIQGALAQVCAAQSSLLVGI